MIDDSKGYIIYAWMRNRLQLKGVDADVYAIIYQFTMDNESEFFGSRSFLAEFTGSSIPTIKRSIASLERRGLIIKTTTNYCTGGTNHWRAVSKEQLIEKGLWGEGQNEPPAVKHFSVGEGQNEPPAVKHFCAGEGQNEPPPEGQNEPPPGSNRASPRVNLTPNNIIYKQNNEVSKKESIETIEQSTSAKSKRAKWKTTEKQRQRSKPYTQIMDEWGVGESLKGYLEEFLTHCQLNGKTVTNYKLEDILLRLYDYYGASDEKGMCQSVERAIRGGYFDILEGK